MRFFRNEAIEDLAEVRLHELEHATGKPLTLPVPIDLLAEKVLGLQLSWGRIEELPGEVVFGAIIPENREIILNENRLSMFNEKPGLLRSTEGHEMGHWDLFVDKTTLNHPALFDTEGSGPFAFRGSAKGRVVVINALLQVEEGRKFLASLQQRSDEPDEARAVNRYAAALSMPRAIISEEALKVDRTKWANLYRLAEKFDVTISALCVRLQQSNLLYVREDKTLFESKDAARGQLGLGF